MSRVVSFGNRLCFDGCVGTKLIGLSLLNPPTNSKLRSINVPHYKVRPCFITRAKQKISNKKKKKTNYNSTDDSSRPALLSRLPSHSSPQPARHTISLKHLTVGLKNRWLRHCSFDQPLCPVVYISAAPSFLLPPAHPHLCDIANLAFSEFPIPRVFVVLETVSGSEEVCVRRKMTGAEEGMGKIRVLGKRSKTIVYLF